MTKRSIRPRQAGFAAAIFLIACASACNNTPKAVVPDTALIQPGGYYVELASVAVPPNSAATNTACKNGQIVVSSWGNLFRYDLTTGATVEITAAELNAALPGGGANFEIGGDPQLVRLRNGRLVYLRQGFSRVPFAAGSEPEWAADMSNGRGYLFLWESSDCGETWQAFPSLDAATALSGACAFPQGVLDENDEIQLWPGGFDRSELYADPWNGTLYLTVGCRGGTHPDYQDHWFDKQVLFVLPEGAGAWNSTRTLTSVGSAMMMTSTKSGRLWLFRCEGTAPRLYMSEDQGKTFRFPQGTRIAHANLDIEDSFQDSPLGAAIDTVVGTSGPDPATLCLGVQSDGDKTDIDPDPLADRQEILGHDYSLSRAGDDQVRLAWPFVENGRQVLRVGIITKAPGKLTVRPYLVFKAQEADASIIQPTFVESDRVDMKAESNVALLYWLESSPGSGKVVARYTTVKGLEWSDAALAGGAPWEARFPDGWDNHWAGDYMNGAFYFRGGDAHFVMAWPQTEASITDRNANIHFSVVSVDP